MTVSGQTGLEALSKRTIVDCDTMDEDVVKAYGPFQDCTSNQAIAFFELSKSKHAGLLDDAVSTARELQPTYQMVTIEELAVEIAMVKLALKIAPHIRGYVHVQTNPALARSKDGTINNAKRLVELFKHLQPDFDTSRICIKIPSTHQGLLACEWLESEGGIRTLATIVFSMVQAVLAAHVKCTYVAPYVNQLKVHFEPGFVDDDKNFDLCVSIQEYYKSIGCKTQVLPASLTSTEEVFRLAGAHHITLPPGLLAQLAKPGSAPDVPSAFDERAGKTMEKPSFSGRSVAYRAAFEKELDAASEEKLKQALEIFYDMQNELIEMVRPRVRG